MKVLKISKIFDFLFGVSFLFLICFVWVRYFLQETWVTLLVSSFITFAIVSLFHISQKYISSRKELSTQEIQNAKNISNNFLLLKKSEILKEFEDKLKVKYTTKMKSDYIIINKKVLRPIFSLQTITSKEVLETYTKTKDENFEKIIIVCKNASEDAKEIVNYLSNINLIILEQFDAYENIYKPLNFEVPKMEIEKKEKKKITDYLYLAFNKSRTKNYLMISVFMLFSSFVLRYNLYYIVFASITTLMGLYSHFNKRFNTEKNFLKTNFY